MSDDLERRIQGWAERRQAAAELVTIAYGKPARFIPHAYEVIRTADHFSLRDFIATLPPASFGGIDKLTPSRASPFQLGDDMDDFTQQLEELHQSHESGHLSDEEYAGLRVELVTAQREQIQREARRAYGPAGAAGGSDFVPSMEPSPDEDVMQLVRGRLRRGGGLNDMKPAAVEFMNRRLHEAADDKLSEGARRSR